MTDVIIILILAVIIFLASYYVYRTKKKGKKCVGCPYADCKSCSNEACNIKTE